MTDVNVTVDSRLATAKLQATPGRVLDALRAAMNESLGYLQGRVQMGMPIDTGVARGSVYTALKGVSARDELTGRVASPLMYVAVIEQGRRAGSTPPPASAIAPWLSRHGGDPRMAFVVARAIGRRGIPAKQPFAKAVKTGTSTVQAIFARHVARLFGGTP